MAEFLTTYGTSSKIEEIIINAKKELYLVSPFLKLSKTFYERLKDASENSIPIKMIYGKNELKQNEMELLKEIKGLELYFFENLHAKCYFNECKMVITSMNMYEFSEKNNREMGVLIDSKTNTELYESAKKETLSIIKSAKLDWSSATNIYKSNNTYAQSRVKERNYNNNFRQGYCIRCYAPLPFNPERPYCSDCYSVWSKFGNPVYEENNCHGCGEKSPATMYEPLCSKCYKKYQSTVSF